LFLVRDLREMHQQYRRARNLRERAATGVQVAIRVLALCVVAGLGLPVRNMAWRQREDAEVRVCVHNVAALAEGVRMYLTDYDGTFPPAARWSEAVSPYLSGQKLFHCPAAANRLSSTYAYNGSLAALSPRELQGSRGRLVVVFESDAGWDACGGVELLPRIPRHYGGDTYGVADGAAFWVSRQQRGDLEWEPVLKEKPGGP
jgi:hypothetical protein